MFLAIQVSKGLDWFCFMDYLKTSIQISQIYTVMAYMPYCFVAWSFLFSSYQKPKLNYPNMMHEVSMLCYVLFI